MFGRLFKKRGIAAESRPEPASGRTPEVERRAAERFETSILTCDLGEITDLSVHGLRVSVVGVCQLKVGESLDMAVHSPTHEVNVKGRVARISPDGPARFVVGIAFEGIDEQTSKRLESMGRFGAVRRSSTDGETAERLRRVTAAMHLPNHYATLGVSPRATEAEIHKAFRDLARKLHPDTNREPDAEKRFCEVNAAHAVVGDPVKRAEYDVMVGHTRAA